MEMELLREPSQDGTTFGELFVDGQPECLTLEDEVRDHDVDGDGQGDLAAGDKIYGETAIPARRYRITLETSPKFGPETLTICNVPGFAGVRIHGGTSKADTLGCIIVGDKLNRANMTISGARTDHVLDNLKAKVRNAIDAGEMVWLTIKNPE